MIENLKVMIAMFGAQIITDYASTVRTRLSIVNMATKTTIII